MTIKHIDETRLAAGGCVAVGFHYVDHFHRHSAYFRTPISLLAEFYDSHLFVLHAVISHGLADRVVALVGGVGKRKRKPKVGVSERTEGVERFCDVDKHSPARPHREKGEDARGHQRAHCETCLLYTSDAADE